ncbi:MAG: STAS domain-containing protein [Phycisphaerae bacterium]|nr:STAS domain-containing protein [Phycisphaerae bacterium]
MDNSPVKNVRWRDKTAIVDVVGDIDLHHSTALQTELIDVLSEKPELMIVNLVGVSYMDSSGVASLVKLLSRSRRLEIPLKLVSLQDRVRSIFEITRLDTVFQIFDTEEQAME